MYMLDLNFEVHMMYMDNLQQLIQLKSSAISEYLPKSLLSHSGYVAIMLL